MKMKIGGLLKRETGGREGRKEGDDCGTRRPATGHDCGTRRSVKIADSGKTGRRRGSNKSDSIKAAFLAACEQGDLEKVKAAILLGVDVNHRLLGTRRTALVIAVLRNNQQLFELLLKQPGLNVNDGIAEGTTALMVAAMLGNEWAITRLCSGSGLEGVNQSDSEGNSPLHWTVKMGHLLATRALLNAPTIDVNATNEDGKTALMLAAEKGRVAILKELLSAPGLNLDMVTLAGKTAEDLARANNQREVLLMIMGGRETLEVQTNLNMVETLERLSVGEERAMPCCLVCTQPTVPPTWIFQCGRCHLVCGSCKPKTKECPECKEAIVGRAEEMEAFVRGDSQGDLENKMALISIRIMDSSAKIANIKLNMQSPKEQVTRLEAFKNLTRKNIREEEEERVSQVVPSKTVEWQDMGLKTGS